MRFRSEQVARLGQRPADGKEHKRQNDVEKIQKHNSLYL
jgi:hypothetical protein